MSIHSHTKDKAAAQPPLRDALMNTPQPTLSYMFTRSIPIVIGQKFNRLTIVCQAQNNPRGKRMVTCKCDCGRTKDVQFSYLVSNHTQSCGCKKREAQTTGSITHGYFGTRIYGIWAGMKNRCYNPKVKTYKYYGAKGVCVCNEWHEFEPFKNWALANGYKDNLTIERKNPFHNYTPENCTWIPMSMQHYNKRSHYNNINPC